MTTNGIITVTFKTMAFQYFLKRIFPIGAFVLLSMGSSHAQSMSPDQHVMEFYEWYVPASDNAPPGYDPLTDPRIKNYITAELQKKIITSISNGTYSALAQDADYFTHTQDFGTSYLRFFHTKIIQENSTDATVHLRVEAPKENGGLLMLCIHLKKINRQWKISSLDPIDLTPPSTDCPTTTP